jgi:hypothetical protein
MDGLPFIDEHRQPTDAPADRLWAALVRFLRDMGGTPTLARVLGCDPLEATPDFTGRPGESVPGFRVAEAEPRRRLALRGRHRFADYALIFVLAEGNLCARSYGAFPGVRGRLYRAAVIGSGAHRVITRRMLRQVVRRASLAKATDAG